MTIILNYLDSFISVIVRHITLGLKFFIATRAGLKAHGIAPRCPHHIINRVGADFCIDNLGVILWQIKPISSVTISTTLGGLSLGSRGGASGPRGHSIARWSATDRKTSYNFGAAKTRISTRFCQPKKPATINSRARLIIFFITLPSTLCWD